MNVTFRDIALKTSLLTNGRRPLLKMSFDYSVDVHDPLPRPVVWSPGYAGMAVMKSSFCFACLSIADGKERPYALAGWSTKPEI